MRRPNGPPTFVIDEDTSISAQEGIVSCGGKAVLLTDRVPRGTPDVDWLPLASQWGQALITRDVSMRFNDGERDALAACGMHIFVIRGSSLRFDELRDLVCKHYTTMCRYIQRDGLPFLARVTRSDVTVVVTQGRRGGIRR